MYKQTESKTMQDYINHVNKQLQIRFFIFETVNKAGRKFWDIYELTDYGYDYYDTYTTKKEALSNLELLNTVRNASKVEYNETNQHPFIKWRNGHVIAGETLTTEVIVGTTQPLQSVDKFILG